MNIIYLPFLLFLFIDEHILFNDYKVIGVSRKDIVYVITYYTETHMIMFTITIGNNVSQICGSRNKW